MYGLQKPTKENIPNSPIETTHYKSNTLCTPCTSEILDIKNMMKILFQDMGTMLNLLTTMLTEPKYWLNPTTRRMERGHTNNLRVNLLELPDNRRLRRHLPSDLPTRFLV
jgi:hypothetical protein